MFTDPDRWIAAQVAQDATPTIPIQNMLYRLCLELYAGNTLVSVPYRSMLLWPRCTPGENLDDLPSDPKDLALTCVGPMGLLDYEEKALTRELKERGISCTEKCPVHPDRFAFEFAGGECPPGWSLHHLYDGVFPFPGRKRVIDARKHGKHFTQTAGIVAVHPVVQEVYDHYACIRRTLRARSFIEFQYDPDHYFAKGRRHNGFGFLITDPLNQDEDPDEHVPENIVSDRTTFTGSIRDKIAAAHRMRHHDSNAGD